MFTSEAAQSSSAVQQMGVDGSKAIFELLMDLIKTMRQQLKSKADQAKAKPDKEQNEPPSADLTPDQQQSVNELCAQGLMHVLEEHGKEVATDRGIHKVYEAEGFVISKDVFDTLTPTYTVTARGESSKEVFSFQTDVNGKLVMLDSPYALSDPQKLQLLEGMQAQIQQQWQQSRSGQTPAAEPTGVQWAQQQVDRYGNFAPAGARAVVVADRLLADHQPPAVLTGNVYSFAKRHDGAISISHAGMEDAPLYRIAPGSRDVQFNPNARKEYSAERHDQDAGRFKSMYEQLYPDRAMPSYQRSQPEAQQSTAQAQQPASRGKGKKSKQKSVDLER